MVRKTIYPLDIFISVILLLFSQSVLAWDDERDKAMELTPNLENGKKIYEVCATCHQDTGWADGSDMSRQQKPGYFPQIAGQHVNVIIKQLADIREGNRDNPMMYPFTLDKYIGGIQGIADVSAYISQLKPNYQNNIGQGNDLELGKQLFLKYCSNCHGENGEGNNVEFYPKIRGQHYNYLLRQFIWIRDGRRRNANEKMLQQISNFSYRDIMAVIDYASRLKPAEDASTSDKKKVTENKAIVKESTPEK